MKAIIRGDQDGVVCATLLKAARLVDNVSVVCIEGVVNGKVKATNQDIVCNLPYPLAAYPPRFSRRFRLGTQHRRGSVQVSSAL